MTVSATTSRWAYNGDGVTTVFGYDNVIFDATDLRVYVGGVLQASGYTVGGVGQAGGGSVTFDTAPPAGSGNVVILRDVPATQGTSYPATGPFPAKSHERALDRLTVLAQQTVEGLARAVRRSVTSPSTADLTLPEPVPGKTLVWNGDGSGLVNDDGAIEAAASAAAAAASAAAGSASAGAAAVSAGDAATSATAAAASADAAEQAEADAQAAAAALQESLTRWRPNIAFSAYHAAGMDLGTIPVAGAVFAAERMPTNRLDLAQGTSAIDLGGIP